MPTEIFGEVPSRFLTASTMHSTDNEKKSATAGLMEAKSHVNIFLALEIIHGTLGVGGVQLEYLSRGHSASCRQI